MSRKTRSLISLAIALVVLSAAAAWQVTQNATAPEPAAQVIEPLRQTQRYWKGNLHTHSFWSDGDDFPEMIADWYRRHGYHFLTLSDHNILSEGDKWVEITPARETALKKYLARFGESWIEQRKVKDKTQVRLKPLREFRSLLEEPARFLLIQGEEITHRFAKKPVHMNGINLRDLIVPLNGDSVTETISANHRAVNEQREKTKWPMITFLNHPNFGWGVTAEEFAASEELRFFEVYNGHPGVKNYGDKTHPGCEQMWDIALALRIVKHRLPLIYGLATDDAHGYHVYGVGKVNPGRGWVMVKAPYLSAEAMVRAMEAGDFYATTGVLLDEVRREGKTLSLKIHAEAGVKYRTQFVGTKKGADLTSKHVEDPKDPKNPSRLYGPHVGAVLGESDSLEPTYQFTGQELYVRARVISTKPHPNPFQKGDVEVAWTQPQMP